MKILYVTRAYGERAGGMERLSLEFSQAADQHPQLQVQVIAHHTRPNNSLSGVRIRSIAFAIGVIPTALRAAREADVVHLGDPVLSPVGWLIQLLYRKPVVVTVHGLDVTYPNVLYQLYLRLFFRNFQMYLPISTHAADKTRALDVRGAVEVVTPGVRDRYFQPEVSRAQLAEVLSLPPAGSEHTKVLLTVGRLVPRKGHAWFIRNVLPRLPENIVYVIAGDGPAHTDIQHAIEDAKQAGRVRLLGRVSEETLQILYNTVDVFVQPNVSTAHDAEGFGLVLLEAALCNRPVVAASLEGIRDAIHDGKNGTLVAPENTDAWVAAIMQALSRHTSSRDYTLRTFAWPNVIEQYVAALQQVDK